MEKDFIRVTKNIQHALFHSLVDAMSHCSFIKAQKDNKLVLHDMAFTIKDVNSYEQYKWIQYIERKQKW